MIKDLIAQFWPWLAVVGVVVYGWFDGRRSARHAEEARRLQAQIKGMENVKKVRDEMDSLDDDAVRARARKRLRDSADR